MILSIHGHSIDFLREETFDGFDVRLRKDGSMSIVIPFEVLGETIGDRREDGPTDMVPNGKTFSSLIENFFLSYNLSCERVERREVV